MLGRFVIALHAAKQVSSFQILSRIEHLRVIAALEQHLQWRIRPTDHPPPSLSLKYNHGWCMGYLSCGPYEGCRTPQLSSTHPSTHLSSRDLASLYSAVLFLSTSNLILVSKSKFMQMREFPKNLMRRCTKPHETSVGWSSPNPRKVSVI